jgi:hypothetical protein
MTECFASVARFNAWRMDGYDAFTHSYLDNEIYLIMLAPEWYSEISLC